MSYPNSFERDLIYRALIGSPARPVPVTPMGNMFCTDCEEHWHACKCGRPEFGGNVPALPWHG